MSPSTAIILNLVIFGLLAAGLFFALRGWRRRKKSRH